MKKTAIFRKFLVWAALFVLLLSVAQLPARADDTAYGEAAYEYLRHINDNFPERLNDSRLQADQSQKVAAGNWISETMRGFGGYTERILYGDLERNYNSPVISYVYYKPGRSSKKIVVGAHYDSVMTKGCEDNGTGVSVLLELAKRFRDVETPLSLEFCFFDGEERLGEAGSISYVQEQMGNGKIFSILLYINLDCVGSGDRLYAYGGDYENGALVRDWGYNMAMDVANAAGIALHTMPDGVDRFKAPTRTQASDQLFFADQKVPYLYLEANAWTNAAGTVMNQVQPYNYNTTDPRVTATEYLQPNGETYRTMEGQIIHAKAYDDLDVLEALFPGRIKQHMAETSRIVTEILKTADANSPTRYAKKTEPVTPTETEAPTTAAPETTTAPETTKAETTEETRESSRETAPPETEPEDESDDPPVPERESEVTPEPAGTESSSEDSTSRAPAPPTFFEILLAVFVVGLWIVWAVWFFKLFK